MYFYRPQTKFAKVMFLQVSVCPQGGRAWLLPGGARGACVVKGGVHGEGGACVVKGGMRGEGGACVAKGGVRGMHTPPRDTAGHCAGGTHPTGMHSCH